MERDKEFDDVLILLDFLKDLEKILFNMSEHTNPFSDLHNRTNTSPGKHTARISMEEAELKIIKLLSSKKFADNLPVLQKELKKKFKDKKVSTFWRERLAEIEEAERDPLRAIYG